jgi:hypothetical protein
MLVAGRLAGIALKAWRRRARPVRIVERARRMTVRFTVPGSDHMEGTMSKATESRLDPTTVLIDDLCREVQARQALRDKVVGEYAPRQCVRAISYSRASRLPPERTSARISVRPARRAASTLW